MGPQQAWDRVGKEFEYTDFGDVLRKLYFLVWTLGYPVGNLFFGRHSGLQSCLGPGSHQRFIEEIISVSWPKKFLAEKNLG